MFCVIQEDIKGRTVKYLVVETVEGYFKVGYIDNFDKVHFYTSNK